MECFKALRRGNWSGELDQHWDNMAERAATELGIQGEWLKYLQEEIESGNAVYHVYGLDDAVWEDLTVWEGDPGCGRFGLELLLGGSEYYTIHFTILPSIICMPMLVLISIIIPVLSQQYVGRESIVDRLRRVK